MFSKSKRPCWKLGYWLSLVALLAVAIPHVPAQEPRALKAVDNRPAKPDTTGKTAKAALELRPHPAALPNLHDPGEVDNPKLVPFIVKDAQTLAGIVVDETDAVLVGKWQYSTHTPPYVGLGYLHDQKKGKGESSVTYQPDLPRAGMYEVRLSHCYNIRRSINTPVTIHHADGETTQRINQQDIPEHKRLFRTLGKFRFLPGKQGWVRISTSKTDGKYVIADAVQFIPLGEDGDAATNSKGRENQPGKGSVPQDNR